MKTPLNNEKCECKCHWCTQSSDLHNFCNWNCKFHAPSEEKKEYLTMEFTDKGFKMVSPSPKESNWEGEAAKFALELHKISKDGYAKFSSEIYTYTKSLVDKILSSEKQRLVEEVKKILDTIDQDDCGEENNVRSEIKKDLQKRLALINSK